MTTNPPPPGGRKPVRKRVDKLPGTRKLPESKPPPELPEATKPEDDEDRPLSELVFPAVVGIADMQTGDIRIDSIIGVGEEEPTSPRIQGPIVDDSETAVQAPPVALGETLQLVHYARRGDTLLISGITPHGRRLTFEQREDRQGWYVVAAGRRRRPTERELGLVVATITQEMEAALVPERQAEVRSAYRLAVASDQPGMKVRGLEAYRDLLLDECAAYVAGLNDRLAVVAVDYQAFKRFANRHGHRIGAAFVQALGERLHELFADEPGVHVFHKSGKSFRLVIVGRSTAEILGLIDRITHEDTREWIVHRVWGNEHRTHPDEVHFHIGLASASRAERQSEYSDLAQRLSDDAYRASKLGQLKGHTSIAVAKSDYRTTLYRWTVASDHELQELAAEMDDGPAEVMAEMSDYLHELVPADLDGMAVAGDLDALVFRAIARDGFWQGTTAMRIAGERLLQRAIDENVPKDPDEHDFVGGFDLGDEYYGIALEDDCLYFCRGDINSAGATRIRAGLGAVQRAVGWERADGGGVVGHFLGALEDRQSGLPFVDRIRSAAQRAFEENDEDTSLHVNDAVDIGDFLFTNEGALVRESDLVEGAQLVLAPPGIKPRNVAVLERRSEFTLRLEIDGEEHPAVFGDSPNNLRIKLRIRNAVASAAICVLRIPLPELRALLGEIREENMVSDDEPMDVLGFLRHISDILLEDHVKTPAKVELALGARYDARRFVRVFSIEDVREGYPGLFYEAVHMDLLGHQVEPDLDRQLLELIGHTMLSAARPSLHPPGVPRD
jgi:GGDEF domain-containing protein